jgi:hypothetical protein
MSSAVVLPAPSTPSKKRLAPDTAAADVKQWTSPRKAAALAAAAAAAQGAAPLPSSSLHVVADKKLAAAAATKKQPKEVAEPAAAAAEPKAKAAKAKAPAAAAEGSAAAAAAAPAPVVAPTMPTTKMERRIVTLIETQLDAANKAHRAKHIDDDVAEGAAAASEPTKVSVSSNAKHAIASLVLKFAETLIAETQYHAAAARRAAPLVSSSKSRKVYPRVVAVAVVAIFGATADGVNVAHALTRAGDLALAVVEQKRLARNAAVDADPVKKAAKEAAFAALKQAAAEKAVAKKVAKEAAAMQA